MSTVGMQQILNFPLWLKRTGPLLMAAFLLTACQVELYSQLDERQANEMSYLLETKGINVSREVDSDGKNTLFIEQEQFTKAMSILSKHGFPKEPYKGIQEAFGEQRLVTSEFEEKVRYTHALNQELAESLSRIEGVAMARVHITVPEKRTLPKQPAQSKASVFIYHSSSADDLIAKKSVIKNLVANSANNINYEDVTVAFFPVRAGMTDDADNADQTTIASLLFSLLVPLAIIGFAIWLWRGTGKSGRQKEVLQIQDAG